MGFWEELERQVGGRLKSALILALSAMLVIEYAAMWGPYKENGAEPPALEVSGQAVLPDNPVDRYFLGMEDISGNARDCWQQLYLDAWEVELAHAYRLMEEELPENFFSEAGYGQRAMQSFGEFLETQAYLEGYYENGLLGEREAVAYARLELARAQALRLYGLIYQKKSEETGGGEMADLYLFPGE